MAKLPSFQFYPGDWMKDPALRSVSVGARGLWMDLLCLMFECPERGVLARRDGTPLTDLEISRATGVGIKAVRAHISELQKADVFEFTTRGAISSRRQRKDQLVRISNAQRQARYKEKQEVSEESNAEVTAPVTPRSQRSSSSSSSSSTPNGVDPPIIPLSVVAKKKSIKVRELPEDFPLPDGIDTPLGRKYLAQWISYKTERNQAYTEAGLMALIAKWAPLGERALVAAVRDSMASNYAGLFENKQNGVATQVRRKGNLDLDRILKELENEEK